MGATRGTWLAIVLLTAGCARTEWVHPTADAEKAATDRAECNEVARIEALEQVQFESLPSRAALRSFGFRQGGSSFAERNSEWYWTQQFFDRCMRVRGYRLVETE